MLKLMRLELKRNNIKTYISASIIIGIIMLGFIYLFAYTPRIDPDPDLQIFTSYNNITLLFTILIMAVFATLSAIMYARFVIEEYKGKRAILLFSYPVQRGKLLFSKLAVVFLFTTAAMTVCNLLIFSIFGISESIFPLVDDALSAQIVLRAMSMTITMSVTAAGIGIIATGIGFIKKSVPTTIVAAVLLSSFLCNILFNSTSDVNRSTVASVIIMSIVLFAGMIVATILMKKVNHMEAE